MNYTHEVEQMCPLAKGPNPVSYTHLPHRQSPGWRYKDIPFRRGNGKTS